MATHFQRPQGRDDRSRREEAPPLAVDDIRFGKQIDPRLFADIAEFKAQAVAGGSRDANKGTQLRRFYDDLVMWHDKVGTSDEQFAALQPYICMLKAKVAYAKGRGHVDASFEALLRRVVDQCTDAATLRQGKLFMEAFMAFYKVHNK